MDSVILLAALLYGAAIGSFMNVCIFRFPRRCLRLWKPQLSFCPTCTRQIPWYENLPVVAFLALGGRCRGCKAKIPLRYFFVELATAFFLLYLASRYLVPTEYGRVTNANGHVIEYVIDRDESRRWATFVSQALFGCALIVCALVDADWRMIPDEVDIPGFLLAPLVAWLVVAFDPLVLADPPGGDPGKAYWLLAHSPDLAGLADRARLALESALPWWGLGDGAVSALTWPFRAVKSTLTAGLFSNLHLEVRAAFASVFGASVGGGIVFAIMKVGERAFKREAMGFGDVKFMAMIGGFTGWQGVLGTIVVASMLGSIWGIAAKVRSGKTTVNGKELAEATALGYWALRLFGAPAEAPDAKPVKLRLGGSLAARLATGEPYLAFGPFLAVGAGLVALWPDVLIAIYWKWAELLR